MHTPIRVPLGLLALLGPIVACGGGQDPSGGDAGGATGSSESTSDVGSATSDTAPSASETATSAGDTATGPADTTEATSNGDTDTGGPFVPDGPWCGRTAKASRDLEGMPLSPVAIDARGGPVGHAVWFGDDWLRAATYDIAEDAWGDTEVLIEGTMVYGFLLAQPEGAADPDGNAFVIHAAGETDPTVVIQRYDVEDDAWTSTTLDGVFEQPKRTSIAVTDDGDAVALVLDRHNLSFTAPFVASYDATSDTWSALHAMTISEFYSFTVPVAWALDRTTADAVIAVPLGHAGIELAHHEAATDTWSAITVADQTSSPQVVATGDGDFAVVVRDFTGFEVRRFHDGDWAAADILASGDVLSTTIAGAPDGRLGAAWFVAPARLLVSTFDVASGSWSEPEDANTELQGAQIDYAPELAMTFDDAGLGLAWTQLGLADTVLGYGRRRTASGEWEALGVVASDAWGVVELADLSSIAGARLQTVISGVETLQDHDYEYACNDPGSPWSTPMSAGSDFVDLDDRDDGGLMVFHGTQSVGASAQYFAAQ